MHTLCDASSGGRAPISSFFPVSKEPSRDSAEECGGMVPRLNLDDICSDVTLPSQSLDMSLASNQQELDIFDRGKPFLDPHRPLQSPASEPVLETRRPWPEERSRSQRSIACDTLGLPSPSPARPYSPRVVINQTNCDHQCQRPRTKSRAKKGSAKVTRRLSKGNVDMILFQELASLLASLDEANALAQRLKRRSEEMLGSLGEELTVIKERGNSSLGLELTAIQERGGSGGL